MSTSRQASQNPQTPSARVARVKYPRALENFLFDSLEYAQKRRKSGEDEATYGEAKHITGGELLEFIREFALLRFGFMARTVFHCWSIHTTADFGRLVYDLIERGRMGKTEEDQLSDFDDVYDFEEALDQSYQIDVSQAFFPKP
jgi:uncharacterized repeat protein (TIGR04138 family)